MNKAASPNMEQAGLLIPRTLSGGITDYTFLDDRLVITDRSICEVSRRKIEIPWTMFGRFISELQEIEKMGRSKY